MISQHFCYATSHITVPAQAVGAPKSQFQIANCSQTCCVLACNPPSRRGPVPRMHFPFHAVLLEVPWQPLKDPRRDHPQQLLTDALRISLGLGKTRFDSKEKKRRVSQRSWKVCWTTAVQSGQDNQFSQDHLILSQNSGSARPKWTNMVHFGRRGGELLSSSTMLPSKAGLI